VLLVAGLTGLACSGRGSGPPADYIAAERMPLMRPDYAGAVLPPNIAPANFRVLEAGRRFLVRLRGADGEDVGVASRSGVIAIPAGPWRELLAANRGRALTLEVYAEDEQGRWTRFADGRLEIAGEGIDPFLVYRRLGADHNLWGEISIRQRDLTGYADTCVLDNRSFGHGCVNCHTFLSNGTDRFLMQIRPGREPFGSGMLLATDGNVVMADTRSAYNPKPGAYASWHPGGNVIAFSINKVKQFFHARRAEERDVLDMSSDIAVYHVDAKRVTSTPKIASPTAMETYPCWSPDGAYLYFSSAPALWDEDAAMPPDRYADLRYSLKRIAYDASADEWGDVETVLDAADLGASLTQPRCSPDGRFIVFCATDYGCFPVYSAEADLWLLDLSSGEAQRMACNSERTESWHSWSSNGRWLVFSSKRLDGLFARPFFTYVDEGGTAHAPFELPQRDPDFHSSLLKNYNVPELVRGAVPVVGEGLARVIRAPESVPGEIAVTGATPGGGVSPDDDFDPWAPAGR
jgi:dipeptidyl aminopeptidase/acylaminoacyl peptidase